MSLIDRGYLRKMIMFEPQFEFCGEKEKDVQTTLRAIEECPTVDAVAVVRCKDCRHYIRWCGKNICNCRYYFDGSGIELREEDYCSRGVKRDETN